MSVIESTPVYESIDWSSIEQRYRDGALRAKLMRLALTLTAIGLALLIINLAGLFWLRSSVEDLIQYRAPQVEATRLAQLGMQRSLASLRGWVALQDPQFKQERRRAWEQEILPAMDRIEALASEGRTRSGSMEHLDTDRRQLDELMESQWWVADVAGTPGNEPARVEYESHIMPIRRAIETSLAEIGELAAAGPGPGGSDQALAALSLFAVHFAASDAALQEAIDYGQTPSVHNFEQSVKAAEASLADLLANRPFLSELQTEHVLGIDGEFSWYVRHARGAIASRRSSDWNVAQYLMERETVPLTRELSARLDRLADEQAVLMRKDSGYVSMAGNTTLALSVALIVLMGALAYTLTNRRAEQITRPVQRLSRATTELAKGQLKEDVPVTTDDELGKLTVVFNHMRVSLQRSEAALRRANDRMQSELESAAGYVQSVLPPPLRWDTEGIGTDWTFIASAELGGDSFGYDWLDDEHFAIYLLDVCGHGVGPAMLSMSAHNALRQRTLPDTDFRRPGEVLKALNRAFPMRENQNKFFTIWYGVYNTTTRRLSYACGGHHAALLFDPEHGKPSDLGMHSFMIGVLDDAEFESATETVHPGSRLYVFSDGLFEVRNKNDDMLELTGLKQRMEFAQSKEQRLEAILASIRRWQENDEFADDYSLLEISFT